MTEYKQHTQNRYQNRMLSSRLILLSAISLCCSLAGCDPRPIEKETSDENALATSDELDSNLSNPAEQSKVTESPAPESSSGNAGAANEQASLSTQVTDNKINILAWNIESDGANSDVIADQIGEMPRYDIYGFTEVRRQDWPAIKEQLGDAYFFRYSRSGFDDRTAFAILKSRFELGKYYEIGKFEDIVINPGNYRSPFVFELKEKNSGRDFLLMINHLARGKADVRQRQAEGLRQWAATQTVPIVAIGDYNFDYVFETQQGNPAFDIFMKDGTFTWVKPQPLVDSNWYDGDGDGQDDYPGSILDFSFVAGDAKNWTPSSRVIVREGDFPDNKQTSDHRPVELTLTPM